MRALFYGDEGHDFIVNYGRDKRGARFLPCPKKAKFSKGHTFDRGIYAEFRDETRRDETRR